MEKQEEYFESIKEIIKPYVQNEEAFDQLSFTSKFIEDLEINSANLVDIILDVEDKYDIEIDNDSMEQMMDSESAIKVILSKIG